MSEPHDSKIDELFDRLKQIEPPTETRIANREAVAAELREMVDVESAAGLPLWRRSVAVPIPVVAAAVALMVIVVASSLSPNDSTVTVDREDPMASETVESPSNAGDLNESSLPGAPNLARSSPVQLAYHESTVYLCGIGPLRTESRTFLSGTEH